jgi:anaerobic selenocysteine-containing dehydrogenase
MMHILVRDGLVDRKFIKNHVLGFDQLETDVLPRYAPETVAKITGIPVNEIEELAKSYGKAKAPFIRQGSGLYRYGNGAMTARIITSLPALVGAWAKPGGGSVGDIPTGAAFSMSKLTREDFLTRPARTININQVGEALNQAGEPPIMSLYVYHSNPVSVYPDQNSIIRGLSRKDLFTVVHERFLTDTTLYADIVLPATSSLEHADVYRSYGHYGVQKVSSVIPPVGESRSNWHVFKALANAMGFEEPFFKQTEEQLIDTFLAEPGPWLSQIDQKKLKEGAPVKLPLKENYKMDFITPSGKVEILNSVEPRPVPEWFPPYGGSAPFWLLTVPSLYSLNSSFNEQKELVDKKGPMSVTMNPKDAVERKIVDRQQVIIFNELGEVEFQVKISDKVPSGVLVADGVSWLRDAPGERTINALTSQRLTDRGNGSTFYDTKVDIRLK